MFSFLETMGIILCFCLASMVIIFAGYLVKDLIQKLIKRLRDPYRCPNCGCIPLGYRSKNTNRKSSSNFCPECGHNLIAEQINQKFLAYNSNEWHQFNHN